MNKLQLIVTMPSEELVMPPEDSLYSAPPSGIMPGTVEAGGRCAVHMSTSDTYQIFLTKKPASWEPIAAQDFTLVQDYDDEGEPVGELQGVEVPVFRGFVAYLPDNIEYDEEGNETGRTPAQPGGPLHVFAGADQWVWSEAEAEAKAKPKRGIKDD